MSVANPPTVFSLPVITCPNCNHGIDPHGLDPGGQCGVGIYDPNEEINEFCECMWSPNDIAATLLDAQLHDVAYKIRDEAFHVFDDVDGHKSIKVHRHYEGLSVAERIVRGYNDLRDSR